MTAQIYRAFICGLVITGSLLIVNAYVSWGEELFDWWERTSDRVLHWLMDLIMERKG